MVPVLDCLFQFCQHGKCRALQFKLIPAWEAGQSRCKNGFGGWGSAPLGQILQITFMNIFVGSFFLSLFLFSFFFSFLLSFFPEREELFVCFSTVFLSFSLSYMIPTH